MAQAGDEGVDLVGPGGLLVELSKQVLETGVAVECDELLSYERHAVDGASMSAGVPSQSDLLGAVALRFVAEV